MVSLILGLPRAALEAAAGAPQAHQGEAGKDWLALRAEAVGTTPLSIWAPGAAMAAMGRPAFAMCPALPGALCALVYSVLK